MRAFVVACLCCSSLAFAQPMGDHPHLGFYLRLDAGVGGFGSSLQERGLAVGGGFGSFGFAVGGAVSENLIIAGHLFGISSKNPELQRDNVTVQSIHTEVGLAAVGPELTYYFMPSNLFFSGTLGVGQFLSTVEGQHSESNYGLAVQLAFGKEWSVGEHWGLGVAAQLTLAANQDTPTPGAPVWSTAGLGVAFTATLN